MDLAHISELFAAFGRIDARNMFGGTGIYAGGLMFGLIVDDVVYLKADAHTVPRFEREGCGPFIYDTKRGERSLKSYWRMPDRLYDDPEELSQWARRAHAVAVRAAARKEKPMKADKPVRRPSRTKAKRPRGRSRT